MFRRSVSYDGNGRLAIGVGDGCDGAGEGLEAGETLVEAECHCRRVRHERSSPIESIKLTVDALSSVDSELERWAAFDGLLTGIEGGGVGPSARPATTRRSM